MESLNILNKLKDIHSAHLFSEIESGFEDIYSGKENIIEKIYNKEKKIREIEDDINVMIYGDLYKKRLDKNRIQCNNIFSLYF